MFRSSSNLSVCAKGSRSVPSLTETELWIELGGYEEKRKSLLIGIASGSTHNAERTQLRDNSNVFEVDESLTSVTS